LVSILAWKIRIERVILTARSAVPPFVADCYPVNGGTRVGWKTEASHEAPEEDARCDDVAGVLDEEAREREKAFKAVEEAAGIKQTRRRRSKMW